MKRSGLWPLLLVGLVIAGLVSSIWLSRGGGESLFDAASFSVGVAFFTFVGALIVWRQPSNKIGWLFAWIGILWVTGDAAAKYSTQVYESGGGETPLVLLGAWYGEWFWFMFLMLTFSILPQLFPTGRPMNERWGRIAKTVFVFVLAMTALAMLEDELDLIAVNRTVGTVHNPFGIPGLHDIETGPVAVVLMIGGLLSVVSGMVAIVLRFKRARGEERQQLEWFTLAVVILVVQFAAQSFAADDGSGHNFPWLTGLALAFVPISAAVAIFRYRLYDIDLVINRALVYAVLSAILAGAYLAIVVLLQSVFAPFTRDSDIAVAGSTLAVAALFRPLRGAVQSFIDRRFYRHKYDAAETLDEFTSTLRDEVDLESLSRELVGVVTSTMQPAHASLWLRGSQDISWGGAS